MLREPILITYVGGPTAIIQIGSFRLLTDPTFDASGGEYRATNYSLFKLESPAVPLEALGRIDAVLLSHDHHFDNLDNLGRELLDTAPRTLTTTAGAARLGGRAEGLQPWQSTTLVGSGDAHLTITATPARHGPPQADRGPVIGFSIASSLWGNDVLYLSGDTVWYEGIAEIAQRFNVTIAVLYMGAAQVEAAGPWPLTFTAAEGVQAARAFAHATIVPLHYQGWAHFREGRLEIQHAFNESGLGDRLRWLRQGEPTALTVAWPGAA